MMDIYGINQLLIKTLYIKKHKESRIFDYSKQNMEEELKKLRKDMGMNRKEFSEYFGIPYRTVQDWELGNRRMPEYLMRLMIYKAKMEKMIQGDNTWQEY